MRQITLANSNIQTSILGFGCAGLMGAGSESERMSLLSTVLAEGVSHFDVAPYYGYGEAEAMLGRFSQSCRDKLTITTKFGIQPPQNITGIKAITAIARKIAKVNPFLRKILTQQGNKLIKTNVFGVNEAEKSLESSLRSLKTDYIDIYLLHDCQLVDTQSPELLIFLEDAVKAGKIRAFGIGTDIQQVQLITNSQPQFSHLIQFEHNIVDRNLEKIKPVENQSIITHRAIATRFQQINNFLQLNPETSQQWSRNLNQDLNNSDTLAQLMLNYAVQNNSNGITLFSSQKCHRVCQNIRSVSQSLYSQAQINELAGLVQQIWAST